MTRKREGFVEACQGIAVLLQPIRKKIQATPRAHKFLRPYLHASFFYLVNASSWPLKQLLPLTVHYGIICSTSTSSIIIDAASMASSIVALFPPCFLPWHRVCSVNTNACWGSRRTCILVIIPSIYTGILLATLAKLPPSLNWMKTILLFVFQYLNDGSAPHIPKAKNNKNENPDTSVLGGMLIR